MHIRDDGRQGGIVVGRGRVHRHALEGSDGIKQLYIYAKGVERRERRRPNADISGDVDVFQHGRFGDP